jgi:Protein of unknown function (DUF3887)
MADVTGPATCAACGRQLPIQQGRGRIRRYCDATCRSAARRRRGSNNAQPSAGVKSFLTDTRRHVKLDSGSPLEALATARERAVAANEALQDAVDRARDAGHSWREIGETLGTTRQAAFQRFGHPVDPRTGTPMSHDVPPDAADRAVALITGLAQGRWDEVVGEFDQRLRERVDAVRLASGWAHTVGMVGGFERTGEPFAHRAADDTMVNIPLHFEAGEGTATIRFDRDGKVAGLILRPASLAPAVSPDPSG